jgi:prefoldin subunit 5
LLINQIEGSDKLREDTQNTISTLREEFDVLLKELAQYKEKDEQSKKSKNPKGPVGVPALNLGG